MTFALILSVFPALRLMRVTPFELALKRPGIRQPTARTQSVAGMMTEGKAMDTMSNSNCLDSIDHRTDSYIHS